MELFDHNQPATSGGIAGALYRTPVYRIGKTEWVMAVYKRKSWNGEFIRVNGFFYRKSENAGWKHEREHPRYNRNDGLRAGLPKSLAGIYYRHLAEIEAALSGNFTLQGEELAPEQLPLF